MFLTGAFSGAGLNATDPDEERDPPPQPTPVSFPVYEACGGSKSANISALPSLQSLFAKVAKPADISQDHAAVLNIEICGPCSVDEMLPLAADGQSYPPQLAPQQAMTAASYADATKTDPAVSRKRKDFDDRLAELRIDNDTAYQTIARTLERGVKGPRLAYMRKFWEGLESMSQYWDCSLDHYYEAPIPAADGEQSSKRPRLDLESEVDCVPRSILKQIDADLDIFANASKPWSESSTPMHYNAIDTQDGAATNGERRSVLKQIDADLDIFVNASRPCNESSTPVHCNELKTKDGAATSDERELHSRNATSELQSQLRYKGRRTHSGREMPDQFRSDTARAFVEGTVWPFQCSVSPPRHMPIVQFGKLNLPVRQTAAVYRLPRDRARARQGRLEGPLIALQVRTDTDFVDDRGQPLEDKSRLDYMRELGGLLQIAQERRREGRTEVKPGEGKWWTTTPRWGGGPGGEVESDTGNSDVVQAAEELLDGIKETKVKREKDGSKSRKRKTPAMLWKELKCGSGHWDAKTDYTAIGKKPSSAYDEVFMVSSLNHHIAILKLTVHVAYVDLLVSGIMPDPMPHDAEWYSPKLQRSKWFDLFDLEQRVEAFRGLWGVMAYLTREPEGNAKVGAADSAMDGAE